MIQKNVESKTKCNVCSKRTINAHLFPGLFFGITQLLPVVRIYLGQHVVSECLEIEKSFLQGPLVHIVLFASVEDDAGVACESDVDQCGLILAHEEGLLPQVVRDGFQAIQTHLFSLFLSVAANALLI